MVSGGVVDGFVVLGLWLVVFVDCGVFVVSGGWWMGLLFWVCGNFIFK